MEVPGLRGSGRKQRQASGGIVGVAPATRCGISGAEIDSGCRRLAARVSVVTKQQRRAQSGRSGRKTERDRKTGVCLGCGRVFAATAPSMVRPSLNKQKSYVHWREIWRMAFLGVRISSLVYSEQCGRLRLRGSQTLTDVRREIARAHHESACFCYKLSPWQKKKSPPDGGSAPRAAPPPSPAGGCKRVSI